MRLRGQSYWRKRRDRLLASRLVLEGNVLDVGSGWRRYGQNAVTLDHDPNCRPDIVADIQSATGLPSGHFHTIIVLDVLEHLRHPFRALDEIKRLLAPEGLLYITVPFFYPRHGDEYFRFTELALRDLLEGFDTEIIAVERGRIWNAILNYDRRNTIVDGYFVKARRRAGPPGSPRAG
jgi:SAM-dependent methyltransferase